MYSGTPVAIFHVLQMFAWVLSQFSCVWLFVTPWTVAHQAPLSMGFTRQEYGSGLPCPTPRIFPTQRWNLCLLSPALAGGVFAMEPCVRPLPNPVVSNAELLVLDLSEALATADCPGFHVSLHPLGQSFSVPFAASLASLQSINVIMLQDLSLNFSAFTHFLSDLIQSRGFKHHLQTHRWPPDLLLLFVWAVTQGWVFS